VSDTSPEAMDSGEVGEVEPPEMTEVVEEAKEAAAVAVKAAEEVKTAAGAGAAELAARAAVQAAEAAVKAAAAAAAVVATVSQSTTAQPVTWFKSPYVFIGRGISDFMKNMKLTWPIILAFILYLLGSASALYGFLRTPAQISSWHRALYDTWVSMSTAGELTTTSSRWVLVLGAANSLVGLLFFGFIVWLVTTSLYRAPRK
jgi:hypothetical protein